MVKLADALLQRSESRLQQPPAAGGGEHQDSRQPADRVKTLVDTSLETADLLSVLHAFKSKAFLVRILANLVQRWQDPGIVARTVAGFRDLEAG